MEELFFPIISKCGTGRHRSLLRQLWAPVIGSFFIIRVGCAFRFSNNFIKQRRLKMLHIAHPNGLMFCAGSITADHS